MFHSTHPGIRCVEWGRLKYGDILFYVIVFLLPMFVEAGRLKVVIHSTELPRDIWPCDTFVQFQSQGHVVANTPIARCHSNATWKENIDMRLANEFPLADLDALVFHWSRGAQLDLLGVARIGVNLLPLGITTAKMAPFGRFGRLWLELTPSDFGGMLRGALFVNSTKESQVAHQN